MKRTVIASLTIAAVLFGGGYALAKMTTTAQAAKVKVLFAPGEYVAGASAAVPGTDFVLLAGTTRFSFDFWASGSNGSTLNMFANSSTPSHFSVSYRTDCAGMNGQRQSGMGSEFGSTPPSGYTFAGDFDRAFCTVEGYVYGAQGGNLTLGVMTSGTASVHDVSGILTQVA